MAEITQNNIQFSNIQNENIFAVTGKYSRKQNDDGTGKFDTTIPGDEITKSINAVEIDWNGATTIMGEEQKVINTSGELISYLATA